MAGARTHDKPTDGAVGTPDVRSPGASGGRLRDKVAIVTGAAGGIGASAVRRFVREGAAVCCVDRDTEAVSRVAADLKGEGFTAMGLGLDVAHPADNRHMVEETVTVLGGLDIFYANAAAQFVGPFEDTGETDWKRLVDTNVLGVAMGITQAVPELRRRGGGSIIVTASTLAHVGDPMMAAYGATKGGVVALCRSLATAFGPDNIRVNAICPGDVETPMLAKYFERLPDGAAARAAALHNYPLRRFAGPEDVPAVAAFLASDDAEYITGTDIRVDGGLLARMY
jgi:NAD(P)-dependent dehydrogenase (short-subunit alcohol dehydrogenase family)